LVGSRDLAWLSKPENYTPSPASRKPRADLKGLIQWRAISKYVLSKRHGVLDYCATLRQEILGMAFADAQTFRNF
jgi:hypothetical protein